jgi:hypothetical protein
VPDVAVLRQCSGRQMLLCASGGTEPFLRGEHLSSRNLSHCAGDVGMFLRLPCMLMCAPSFYPLHM